MVPTLENPKARSHFKSSMRIFLSDLKAGLAFHYREVGSWDRAQGNNKAPCFRLALGSGRMVMKKIGHHFDLGFINGFCWI